MSKLLSIPIILLLCISNGYSHIYKPNETVPQTRELLQYLKAKDREKIYSFFKEWQNSSAPSNLNQGEPVRSIHEIYDLLEIYDLNTDSCFLPIQDSASYQIAAGKIGPNDVFKEIDTGKETQMVLFRPAINADHFFLSSAHKRTLQNFIDYINATEEYQTVFVDGKLHQWKSNVLFDPLLPVLRKFIPIDDGEGSYCRLDQHLLIKKVTFNKNITTALVEVEYLQSGERFYLEKRKKQWVIVKSFTMWIE